MRYGETGSLLRSILCPKNIEIERPRSPALGANSPRVTLQDLERKKQLMEGPRVMETDCRIEKIRLFGAKGQRGVERGHGNWSKFLPQRSDHLGEKPLRAAQVSSQPNNDRGPFRNRSPVNARSPFQGVSRGWSLAPGGAHGTGS